MKILLLVILFINVETYRQENDDEDFIDVGVRLTGDNRDFLVADLFAEERDIINAGHVSIRVNLFEKKRFYFGK
jgi:hypothetical protein